MAEVELRGVSKRFGDTVVVHPTDLRIEDREFAVLVGPSGCGKTTTLRMVAGLEDASSGDLLIGGRRVNDVPPRDRDVAMVFQSYALYPHMTVFENMAFGLRLRKVPKVEIEARVREAAGILGLDGLMERKPRALSGGQRQRVAMGRAIVRKPSVFLFDEPLSNLDAKLRVQMRAEIARLHRRLDTTVVYVTHDQVEAMTLADRIVVMKDGAVQQVGRPLEVYDAPANLFVAGFIGSPAMNILDAEAFQAASSVRVICPAGIEVTLPGSRMRSGAAVSGRVLLGVRPEDLEITACQAPGPACTVEVIEPMGAETYLHLRSGGVPLTSRTGPRPGVRVGESVRLSVDPLRAHLFDAATQAAMSGPAKRE